MMVILERDEMEWLNELRNAHFATKILFRMYDDKRIKPEEFVEHFRKDFEATSKILATLSGRGL